MPIDARIALGAQAPQMAQPMELYGNALKLQSMQRQNALAEQEMATAQTNQRRQSELLNFMQSAEDPYAEDVQMQLPRFGQPGIDMAAKLQERNRYRAETKVKQAEYEAKTLEAAQAMMPAAVNDPNQYARVVEFVRSRDPAMADRMPPWSKEGVLNLMTTAKDMVAQHRMTAEQQSMATDRAAGREISRGQLTVAQRNAAVNEAAEARQAASGVGAPKPKDATVSEQQAAYHGKRILDAAAQIAAATKTTPSANRPSALEATVSATPGVRGLVGGVRSAPRQIVTAAQREMLDALLYMATGAAYNKEQLEGEIESTLPSYLDKPETVKAKRDRLRKKIDAAKIRAGSAWTPEMDAALAVLDADAAASGAAPAAPSGGTNIDALLDKYKDKP